MQSAYRLAEDMELTAGDYLIIEKNLKYKKAEPVSWLFFGNRNRQRCGNRSAGFWKRARRNAVWAPSIWRFRLKGRAAGICSRQAPP